MNDPSWSLSLFSTEQLGTHIVSILHVKKKQNKQTKPKLLYVPATACRQTHI